MQKGNQALERMVGIRMAMELSRKTIPYTPVSKPLSEMTIMIVSTAGAHLITQDAFNTGGDSTYRVIAGDVSTTDFTVTHGAPVDDYNWEEPRKDINTIVPIDRLRELHRAGLIGGVAEKHISMMGYALRLNEINSVTAPAIAKEVDHSRADAVLLTAG